MNQETTVQSWQRFTWQDAVFIILAIALGCLTSFSMCANAQTSPENPLPWPACAKSFELIIVGIVLGCQYTAPLILLSQGIFRKRRQRLHVGEYLWLSPLVLHAATCLASNLAPNPIWFHLFVAGIVIGSCAATIAIIGYLLNLSKKQNTRICTWTNLFGSIACTSAGILLFYTLIVDPIRI